MTKTDFKKQLTSYFSKHSFFYKNNHYYKEVAHDILIVFGIQMSCYGACCYLESGYCFKSISKYLPYPKFNQLNLNCGRILTSVGVAMEFEEVNDDIMAELINAIDQRLREMIDLSALGKDEIVNHYLSDSSNHSWYIIGEATANYFGLPKEAFRYHIVLE